MEIIKWHLHKVRKYKLINIFNVIIAHFVSREEYRAKKALDEARKAGTAPAEVDENGKEINPHMPQYITQAPWYLNAKAPSLKHHMLQKENQKLSINEWYQRGERKVHIDKIKIFII